MSIVVVVGWFNVVVKLFATGCPGLVVCATSGTPVETCSPPVARGCVGGCTARGTSGSGIALRPEGKGFGDEALRDFPSGGGLGMASAVRLRINR